MEWDEVIESWGFHWVNDYTLRATKNNKGREISIMAFEDDEYEVCWIDGSDQVRETAIEGIEELKEFVEGIE